LGVFVWYEKDMLELTVHSCGGLQLKWGSK
jgi:hypothetical protein